MNETAETASPAQVAAAGAAAASIFIPEFARWGWGTEDDGTEFVQQEDTHIGVLLRASPVDDGLWHARAWVVDSGAGDLGLLRLAWAHRQQENLPDFACSFGPDAVAGREFSSSDTMAVLFARLLDDLAYDARREQDQRILARHAEGISLDQYGGSVPYQAEGTWLGHPFYFRYRHGYASLSVGLPGDDPVEFAAWRAGQEFGEAFDGTLSFEEFCLLLCLLSTRLSRAPYPFTFRVLGAETGAHHAAGTTVTLHGHTPADALARAADAPFWANTVFAEAPENTDHRAFPDIDPVFPVSPGSVAAAEALVAARKPA